jgi:hypothetical protein
VQRLTRSGHDRVGIADVIAAGIVWASEFGSLAAHMTVGLVGLLVVTDAASQAGDRRN